MKFYKKSEKKESNELILVYSDYTFDCEPMPRGSAENLVVNDLNIELTKDDNFRYVWGFNPLVNSIPTNHCPENREMGQVHVQFDEKDDFVPGISQGINTEHWPIYVHSPTGWYCIGNPETEGKQLVEFLTGCVAILEGDQLTALWLKPKFVEP